MSDRTHSKPASSTGSTKLTAAAPRGSRWRAMLAIGSVAVLAAGGGVYLAFRPEPANAQGGARSTPPGAATVRTAAGQTVAVVNGEPIGWEQLAQACIDRVGAEELDNIISQRIIEQACRARGIQVTNDEIRQEIERMAERFGLTPHDLLQMLERERGITPDQYAANIIWPSLALQKLAGSQIEVDQQDVLNAYESHYGERVLVRAIVLDNLQRATECWDLVHRNPQDFSRLAREYSIDPTSRALGGQVPPIRRHSGQPRVEEAAFALQQGEVSEIIETGGYYMILLCEGRTEPSGVTFEQVQGALYDEVRERQTQQAMADVFRSLREQSHVENFLYPDQSNLMPSPQPSLQPARQPAPARTNSSQPVPVVGGGASGEAAAPGEQIPPAPTATQPPGS